MPSEPPDILGRAGGEPIPNLAKLPSDEWFAALRPLSMAVRRLAISQAPPRPEVNTLELLGELEVDDWTRQAAMRSAVDEGISIPVPSPAAAPRRDRSSPQVNFRLEEAAVADLDRAAALLGMKRTSLARALTMNGVRRILLENRELSDT